MFKNYIYAFVIMSILINLTQLELSGKEVVNDNIELNNVIIKCLNSVKVISSSDLHVILEEILINTDIHKSGKIIGIKSHTKSNVVKNKNLNSLIPALLYNSVAFDSKAKEDMYELIKRLNEGVFEQFNIKPDSRYYNHKNTMISPALMPAVSVIYEIPYSSAGNRKIAIIVISFIKEYDFSKLKIEIFNKNDSDLGYENSGLTLFNYGYVLCQHKAQIMKHLFKKFGIY